MMMRGLYDACLLACLVREGKGFIEGGGEGGGGGGYMVVEREGKGFTNDFMFLARYLWFLIWRR